MVRAAPQLRNKNRRAARRLRAVARRVNRDAATSTAWSDDPADNFYYLTDVMFSVLAVTDSTGLLHTRLDYTPYGVAMHGFAADANGDGALTFNDLSIALANHNSGSDLEPGDTGYDPDAFLDGGDEVDVTAFSGRYNDYAPGGSNPTFNAGWIDNPEDPNGPDNSVGYDGYWFDLAGATEATSTGLYMVRFRVYDPKLGRWLQRDPAGVSYSSSNRHDSVVATPEMGGADADWGKDFANLYHYARASPATRLDPSGLRCCIAVRCGDVYRLGIKVGTHCGLVFCENTACFVYDGSGGTIHKPGIRRYVPPRKGSSTGPMNCSFPDSTCKCLRDEQRRWNEMKIPRDHTCANSNWHLKCVTSKCGISISWGSGRFEKPIGWDCPGYISDWTCENSTPYDSDFWGPGHRVPRPVRSPCP